MSLAPKPSGNLVASLHIWALADPEMQKVAEIIDEAKKTDTNGQLSFKEVKWVREELHKQGQGDRFSQGFDLKEKLAEKNLSEADFRRLFKDLESFFVDPRGKLNLIKRPALNLGGKQFQHVFEIPKEKDLDAMLNVMRRAGYDLIIARCEKTKRIFVALHEHGVLNLAGANLEAGLDTEFYDQVTILRVADLNNGFLEGLTLIPRTLRQKVSDVFSFGKNRVRKDETSASAEVLGSVAAYHSAAAAVAMPKATEQDSDIPGVALATLIGVGAVSLSTLIATAPTAAGIMVGFGLLGSLYNACFGKFRKQDPFFILNIAGVQLNASGVSLEELTGATAEKDR